MKRGEWVGRLGLRYPLVQAPMAGVSTPDMAAAVSTAGGLGSLGLGAAAVEDAREMIRRTRALTTGPFNANVFCHRPALANPVVEAAWLDRLAPLFAGFGAQPPGALAEIYASFLTNDAMIEMLLAEAPPVVSFHFGLPGKEIIDALHTAGCVLLATATSVDEGLQIADAGIDAIVAQGWEAGGHRGCFDPDAPDARCRTVDLTRDLVARLPVPIIAAGGIMDGAGIKAVLAAGADGAQLGTAFIGCRESSADAAYRAALLGAGGHSTVMTRVISGRPARCLGNRFTAWGADAMPCAVPDYPLAYDAGKALNAAAKAAGEAGFGAQWAGQGAPQARLGRGTAELMAALVAEMA